MGWLLQTRIAALHEWLRQAFGAVDSELTGLKDRLAELQDTVTEIQESAKEAAMTPIQREAYRENKTFERTLPISPEPFIGMAPGDMTKLWMKVYMEHGTPLIYDLVYRHRAIEQLSSDPKHPIAHGEGRLEPQDDWRPVRILFTPSGGICRGLSLEGEIKDWRPRMSRVGSG